MSKLQNEPTPALFRQAHEQDYFQHARDQPDPARLFLSPPSASVLGVFAMNLTIPVTTPDVAFDGVVTATLDPVYLRGLLHTTRYAEDVWSGIGHGNGLVLLQEPGEESLAGRKVDQPGTFFRRQLGARLLEDDANGLLVRFSVEDTGIGITSEQLPRLFQVFEQADASITRKFGGTGLGLAITQRLAQLMGGECGVQSEPGAGSAFWFTARLQHGHGVVPSASVDASANAEEQLRRGHRGARILLAEDNEVNREVALAMLHGVGMNVDIAADGREALNKVRTGHYDLVLMDMQMPEMGGLEATQAIRALPGWRDRPILALTANAFQEDRLACEAAGMNDFIAKPMDVGALYGALLRWLEAGAASRADA